MKKVKYVGHLCQNTGFNKPNPTRKTDLFLLLLKRKDNMMIRRVLPQVHQRYAKIARYLIDIMAVGKKSKSHLFFR